MPNGCRTMLWLTSIWTAVCRIAAHRPYADDPNYVAVAGSALSVKASPSLADMLHQVTTLCAPPEQPTNQTLDIGPLGSGVSETSKGPVLLLMT